MFLGFERAFQKNSKPVISAVNGKALGGGFELALISDLIVCSENAFFALPEITLGLIPGMGGTQRFTRIVGEKTAMRHILSGEGLTGAEASRMNVATLVQAENFEANVDRLAKTIAAKALTSLIIAKKAIRIAGETSLQSGLDYERTVFYPLSTSKASKEGVTAFIEKRKANFRGL